MPVYPDFCLTKYVLGECVRWFWNEFIHPEICFSIQLSKIKWLEVFRLIYGFIIEECFQNYYYYYYYCHYYYSSKNCSLYSGFTSPKTKFLHMSLFLVSSVSPWVVIPLLWIVVLLLLLLLLLLIIIIIIIIIIIDIGLTLNICSSNGSFYRLHGTSGLLKRRLQ